MWWRRGGREEAAAPAVPPAPAVAPVPAAPVQRWRELAPIRLTLAESPLVNPVQRFSGSLAAWQDPRFLAPLRHVVGADEPSGLIEAAPVPSARTRDDGPELPVAVPPVPPAPPRAWTSPARWLTGVVQRALGTQPAGPGPAAAGPSAAAGQPAPGPYTDAAPAGAPAVDLPLPDLPPLGEPVTDVPLVEASATAATAPSGQEPDGPDPAAGPPEPLPLPVPHRDVPPPSPAVTVARWPVDTLPGPVDTPLRPSGAAPAAGGAAPDGPPAGGDPPARSADLTTTALPTGSAPTPPGSGAAPPPVTSLPLATPTPPVQRSTLGPAAGVPAPSAPGQPPGPVTPDMPAVAGPVARAAIPALPATPSSSPTVPAVQRSPVLPAPLRPTSAGPAPAADLPLRPTAAPDVVGTRPATPARPEEPVLAALPGEPVAAPAPPEEPAATGTAADPVPSDAVPTLGADGPAPAPPAGAPEGPSPQWEAALPLQRRTAAGPPPAVTRLDPPRRLGLGEPILPGSDAPAGGFDATDTVQRSAAVSHPAGAAPPGSARPAPPTPAAVPPDLPPLVLPPAAPSRPPAPSEESFPAAVSVRETLAESAPLQRLVDATPVSTDPTPTSDGSSDVALPPEMGDRPPDGGAPDLPVVGTVPSRPAAPLTVAPLTVARLIGERPLGTSGLGAQPAGPSAGTNPAVTGDAGRPEPDAPAVPSGQAVRQRTPATGAPPPAWNPTPDQPLTAYAPGAAAPMLRPLPATDLTPAALPLPAVPPPTVSRSVAPTAPAMVFAPQVPVFAPQVPTVVTVQRDTGAAPVGVAPPAVPAPPAEPAPAGAPATEAGAPAVPTPGAPIAPAVEPEELLARLFDPLLRRLKAELRVDRDRRGWLTDLPR